MGKARHESVHLAIVGAKLTILLLPLIALPAWSRAPKAREISLCTAFVGPNLLLSTGFKALSGRAMPILIGVPHRHPIHFETLLTATHVTPT